MIRRRLKFAAVLVAVVLALTGFSSGHGKSRGSSGSSGSGGSSGDSGGGCSNSKKSNGSYGGTHSDSDTDYSYDNTPTAKATSGNDVVAEVITCVRRAAGKRKAVTYATVRVQAPTGTTATYEVDVDFRGASGAVLDNADTEVTLDSGESTTVRIPMETPSTLRNVTGCKATARVAS
ncbi:hypothetical protein [Streptomyces liangshanensis]|uniref:Secreted protein n=1 Tax=Streptomyces liangshanensis TaxID=2717324 RepID=A0A6G9H1T0_9ACTN|nr:hypothetical protein [Streptomyces liangshanensis]QIQ04276.1 hypothetical protein HA039_19955 [Streptomyces liangshanensis]